MLKGIDPLITPDLIKLLMEMGHDDSLALVDANFTALSLSAGKPVLRLSGCGMLQVIKAIEPLLPLASDVDCPIAYMQVTNTEASYRSALQREVLALFEGKLLSNQIPEPLERYSFYSRVRDAFAIVVTGELQPFGNFILRKGVIGDNLRP